MRILISGAGGLIGRRVTPFLQAKGWEVTALVRRSPRSPRERGWDPLTGQLNPEDLEGFDAILHLAGENIMGLRWTAAKKRRIAASRRDGTRLLTEVLRRLKRPPASFISASAVGVYGSRGAAELSEDSALGRGFLAQVVQDWEAPVAQLEQEGFSAVRLRWGVVLDPGGGMLAQVLPLFRLGLGGRLGPGTQYLSWLGAKDVGPLLLYLLERKSSGVYHAVAPQPVTNADFTRAVAEVLRRPALLPVPAWALRFFLGEIAQELLLASCRAKPQRLAAEGYEFKQPDLVPALRDLLTPDPVAAS